MFLELTRFCCISTLLGFLPLDTLTSTPAFASILNLSVNNTKSSRILFMFYASWHSEIVPVWHIHVALDMNTTETKFRILKCSCPVSCRWITLALTATLSLYPYITEDVRLLLKLQWCTCRLPLCYPGCLTMHFFRKYLIHRGISNKKSIRDHEFGNELLILNRRFSPRICYICRLPL